MSTGWQVLRVLWCGRSDFHVDGKLSGFDFTQALRSVHIPTLLIYGDHDVLQPDSAAATLAAIRGSYASVIANSGHMTFVDQTESVISTVQSF